jgi:hypothetical protein
MAARTYVRTTKIPVPTTKKQEQPLQCKIRTPEPQK